MTRAKNTPVTRRRRKKILKQVKGYSIKTLKTAKEQEMNALKDAYIGRKQRKRFFRSNIWIPRINSIIRSKYCLRYSQFIHLKKLARIELNRKQLSEMMIKQPTHFDALIEKLKTYEKTNPKMDSSLTNSVA